MATFKIHDRAGEFRVELAGRFAGPCVHELRTAWQEALREAVGQRFTIDLARVSGWDAEGRKLLKEMYQHGTDFAAGTAHALELLREISTRTLRGPLPLLQEIKSPRRRNTSMEGNKTLSKAAGQ